MTLESFLADLKQLTRTIDPVGALRRRDLFFEIYLPDHIQLIDAIRFDGSYDDFFNQLNQNIFSRDTVLTKVFLTRGLKPRVGSHERIDTLLAQLPHIEAELNAAAPPHPTVTQDADSQPHPLLYLIYSAEDATLASRVAERLSPFGYRCRLHRSRYGSEPWHHQVRDDLDIAYGALVLVTQHCALESSVEKEILYAHSKEKPLFALQLTNTPYPAFLPLHKPAVRTEQARLDLTDLAASLPRPRARLGEATWRADDWRSEEVRYMRQLGLDHLQHVSQYYTALSGQSQISRSISGQLQIRSIVARHEFEHVPWLEGERGQPQVETYKFEDAISELKAIRRAVLLGEPGSGKTTTLYKLAADLIDRALPDKEQPVPVLIRLGEWRDAKETFEAFLIKQLGRFDDAYRARLKQKSLFLLLDGLNEIPASQHEEKYGQVGAYADGNPDVGLIVSCRELDYPPERQLALDTVTVSPLDPVRVYEFVRAYLDRDDDNGLGDDLFWKLAGKQTQETYARYLDALAEKVKKPFETFWLADQLPNGLTWGWVWSDSDKNRYWEDWLKQRTHPGNLLLLAFNPYMLFMLVQVYQAYEHTLPANRGQLFDRFVEQLLVRERLIQRMRTGGVVVKPEGKRLLQGLTQLAYQMQAERADASRAGGETTLPVDALSQILSQEQQYQAASCNLLTIDESVRFTHQLLQEYFVARAMRERIFEAEAGAARLRPAKIWPPDAWWQPTNWEEATILLAGLYSDDCTPVLDWLAEAQPELAARCMAESGAHTPDGTKRQLRKKWLPRLTDLERDPDPRARAAIGRALGRVSLESGEPLDNRRGVSYIVKDGLKIPDIVWGKTVPPGQYRIGGDKDAYDSLEAKSVPIKAAFKLAIYPITFIQFDCFINADDFADERWWRDVAEQEKAYGTVYQLREISEQAFPFHTHPRESVSWYQAIVFCRWLSAKLGYAVDLPHEHEWEVAARYNDGRFYPYGNEHNSQKGNTNRDVGQTTAVGLYPNGIQSELGLYDISGNVWEWCRNKYDDEADTAVDQSAARRVLRGGSWRNLQFNARAAARFNSNPANRDLNLGFRLVVRPPS